MTHTEKKRKNLLCPRNEWKTIQTRQICTVLEDVDFVVNSYTLPFQGNQCNF